MDRIDRAMTVWMISMVAMIVIGLPTAIIGGMYYEHKQRNAVEKPTAFYHLAEYQPEFNEFESSEHRGYQDSAIDGYERLYDNGKWYWASHRLTYRVAQTITGVMLGTEGTQINYITPYVVASICEHGEYQHVATCCE